MQFIEEIQEQYKLRGKAIETRLREFTRVPQTEYFYELAYCLLTPQTSAIHAGRVIGELKKNDFQYSDIHPGIFLCRKEHYIRFHNMKSGYLVAMKKQYPELYKIILSTISPDALREELIARITGMGYKEASHFLRNIGKRNLAILDRHILKNLVRCGVIQSVPKTLSQKLYLEIEQKFLQFAEQIKIPMDALDLLFWSMETGMILK